MHVNFVVFSKLLVEQLRALSTINTTEATKTPFKVDHRNR